MDTVGGRTGPEIPTTKIHLGVVIRPIDVALAIFHHDRLATGATLLFFIFCFLGLSVFSWLDRETAIKPHQTPSSHSKTGVRSIEWMFQFSPDSPIGTGQPETFILHATVSNVFQG